VAPRAPPFRRRCYDSFQRFQSYDRRTSATKRPPRRAAAPWPGADAAGTAMKAATAAMPAAPPVTPAPGAGGGGSSPQPPALRRSHSAPAAWPQPAAAGPIRNGGGGVTPCGTTRRAIELTALTTGELTQAGGGGGGGGGGGQVAATRKRRQPMVDPLTAPVTAAKPPAEPRKRRQASIGPAALSPTADGAGGEDGGSGALPGGPAPGEHSMGPPSRDASVQLVRSGRLSAPKPLLPLLPRPPWPRVPAAASSAADVSQARGGWLPQRPPAEIGRPAGQQQPAPASWRAAVGSVSTAAALPGDDVAAAVEELAAQAARVAEVGARYEMLRDPILAR
jgi:hypothetical protein